MKQWERVMKIAKGEMRPYARNPFDVQPKCEKCEKRLNPETPTKKGEQIMCDDCLALNTD